MGSNSSCTMGRPHQFHPLPRPSYHFLRVPSSVIATWHFSRKGRSRPHLRHRNRRRLQQRHGRVGVCVRHGESVDLRIRAGACMCYGVLLGKRF
ncbi:hypothetical protein FIBSPDRAFT_66824 [Athelia psychrophila]|uniref:Uncharacterized protein n=1 Tax=Athelia psychrophila TaxID=1759441 RepID=A0A166EU57_9AGAM|nr:hypothetical protein FIBSPDRAFT_66824 [Fibularhizoctonia sp. CBS 109695]